MLIKILSIGITTKGIMLRSIIIHVHQNNILTQKEILVLMAIWQLAPMFFTPLLEDKEDINHVHKIVALGQMERIENIK